MRFWDGEENFIYCEDDFQFSLWDSLPFTWQEGVNHTFNSLYEILFQYIVEELQFFSPFQFSLWDSDCSFTWSIRLCLFFQFSLWDSPSLLGLNWQKKKTFNSLYEILFFDGRRPLKSIFLSILFMRFWLLLLQKSTNFICFQFSLWDSWNIRPRCITWFRQLSILFMRFLFELEPLHELELQTFNSLYEILPK